MKAAVLFYILVMILVISSCDPKQPSGERDAEYMPSRISETIIPDVDSVFVAKASDGNLMEVRLGK